MTFSLVGQDFNHALLLSVDGLHSGDINNPLLQPYLKNITQLLGSGVNYSNASTTFPSDSFPGELAPLTGASPATTGIWYDDAYNRALYAPGTTLSQIMDNSVTPGAEVNQAENLDFNNKNLNGLNGLSTIDQPGYGYTSLDPSQMPVDAKGNPVYPNQTLNRKVNTIFNVASKAGLYTAFSDKHPAYQIAYGNGTINDFYAPEINSNTALVDKLTGQTVNVVDLLAKEQNNPNAIANIRRYSIVDSNTVGNDPNLIGNLLAGSGGDTTKNILLTEAYDDLKVNAILNEIKGLTHDGQLVNGWQKIIPSIMGMNFQAVSVAEKYYLGGIDEKGKPSAILEGALKHTDASIGKIMVALKHAGIWDKTEITLFAKHGQDPLQGIGTIMSEKTLPDVINSALGKTAVAQATQDDGSLIWLQNQSDTAAAVKALKDFGTVQSQVTVLERTG